jgi:hypothetical protein
VTTTYDFAAPIREWGGLWDKYYELRGIGAFLGMFGKMLTRSQVLENACHSTSADMTVSERTSGESGFVFVRTNTESQHHFKLKFRDPTGSGNFSVPREGELIMGPRTMKILPVQIPVAGGHLRYSTAELLAQGTSHDRSFLVIYDEPGSLVEVALKAKEEPHVVGETLYQSWDKDTQSMVTGLRIEEKESFLLFDNQLQIVALPRDIALRTWVEEFPGSSIPGAGSETIAIPFITDAYLLVATGSEKRKIWADLDFLPGDHSLTVLLPSQPVKCRIDGVTKEVRYDQQWRSASIQVVTPSLPAKAVEIKNVQASVEHFDAKLGNWITSPARVLEDIGPIPYGYVKYKAHLKFNNEPKMYISTFTDDGKKVFLNGKYVPEASKPNKFVEFSPFPYLNPGDNTVEISYELFGSTEFGDEVQMSELKGVSCVRLSGDPEISTKVESWQIQTFPASMRGREVDPNFFFGAWRTAALGGASPTQDLVPAFTWCRSEFVLTKAEGWSVPWKLILEADRDALIYLNGRFVGRSVTVGPQSEFYLPEPYLRMDNQPNLLTVLLAYTENPAAIRTLRIEPYVDYSARRTRLQFEW